MTDSDQFGVPRATRQRPSNLVVALWLRRCLHGHWVAKRNTKVGRQSLAKDLLIAHIPKVSKEFAMRRYELLIAGMLMVGGGAYLIFRTPPALPLWFIWIAGPILWYMGIAVCIAGIGVALFLSSRKHGVQRTGAEQKKEKVTVLPLQSFESHESAPSRVLREIPAMGAFIL
jgi:hypothetical protein